MLGTSPVVAFVATADAASARHFYEHVLGLRLLADEPFALLFDAGGTRLHVQKVQVVQSPPYTVLGWAVADLRSTIENLSDRGVIFERFPAVAQDEQGVWIAPSGARVAWFRDPDGNLLSLTET